MEYPVGHRRRRAEGIPLLIEKFASNLASRLSPPQRQAIMDVCRDAERLHPMPVDKFLDMWIVKSIE